jgi:hypothetical protein
MYGEVIEAMGTLASDGQFFPWGIALQLREETEVAPAGDCSRLAVLWLIVSALYSTWVAMNRGVDCCTGDF